MGSGPPIPINRRRVSIIITARSFLAAVLAAALSPAAYAGPYVSGETSASLRGEARTQTQGANGTSIGFNPINVFAGAIREFPLTASVQTSSASPLPEFGLVQRAEASATGEVRAYEFLDSVHVQGRVDAPAFRLGAPLERGSSEARLDFDFEHRFELTDTASYRLILRSDLGGVAALDGFDYGVRDLDTGRRVGLGDDRTAPLGLARDERAEVFGLLDAGRYAIEIDAFARSFDDDGGSVSFATSLFLREASAYDVLPPLIYRNGRPTGSAALAVPEPASLACTLTLLGGVLSRRGRRAAVGTGRA